MHLISVGAGQEVMATITQKAVELGIRNAAIVSLIGAVESAGISTMARDDAGKDIITEYDQPLELLGTGEIKDGRVHIHFTVGAEGNESHSGHLHHAIVRTFFVNAYLIWCESLPATSVQPSVGALTAARSRPRTHIRGSWRLAKRRLRARHRDSRPRPRRRFERLRDAVR